MIENNKVSIEFRYLIRLLYAAIADREAENAPEGLDYEKLYFLARRHSITAVVFLKLKKDQVPVELYESWRQKKDHAFRRTILFDAERKALFELFEKQKICYLPLKGILLKDLYPFGTREFADNDILIHMEDSKRVEKLMKERGYEAHLSEVHDAYHKDPVFNFELHKSLFAKESPCYEAFQNIYSRVYKEEGRQFCYQMKDEDFFVYNISHFFKHYDNAGAGLRSFADFWLMRRKFSSKPGFDFTYTENLMKKAGVLDFYHFLCSITEKLFSNEEAQMDSDTLQFICKSGVYGTYENSVKSEIRKKGKKRFVFQRLFLPYRHMKIRFPVLRYLPVLLPLFWIIRLFIFYINRSRRKQTINALSEK